MANCPLADECPSFTERIEGMGCQHFGDRGGKAWCNHYSQPISELKTQPVKPGEEVVVDITDIHESGAGVGRTEEGFIILVDNVLPDARARVVVDRVFSNHARGESIERLPLESEEDEEATDDGEDDDDEERRPRRERLGRRDNFWGG
ncbi:MAG: TRAM domain-containing protein [Halobacteriota archaeon]